MLNRVAIVISNHCLHLCLGNPSPLSVIQIHCAYSLLILLSFIDPHSPYNFATCFNSMRSCYSQNRAYTVNPLPLPFLYKPHSPDYISTDMLASFTVPYVHWAQKSWFTLHIVYIACPYSIHSGFVHDHSIFVFLRLVISSPHLHFSQPVNLAAFIWGENSKQKRILPNSSHMYPVILHLLSQTSPFSV